MRVYAEPDRVILDPKNTLETWTFTADQALRLAGALQRMAYCARRMAADEAARANVEQRRQAMCVVKNEPARRARKGARNV